MTTLPITVPYTFANATTTQRLSYLDADFAVLTNAINGIGNGSVALSNVTITGGTVAPTSNSIPVSAIQASGNLTSTTFLSGSGVWSSIPSGAGGTVIYVDVNGGSTASSSIDLNSFKTLFASFASNPRANAFRVNISMQVKRYLTPSLNSAIFCTSTKSI
jgi:hypothetical protein